MKISIPIFLFLLMIFSCKQKKDQVYIEPTKHFSIPTNIKYWKNFKEIYINDSIKKVSGNFKNYKVNGFFNNRGQKINWWKIENTDLNKKEKNVRLEYRIIDDREFVNQFIYYDSKGDYVNNSMFFLKQKLDKNILVFTFYTPRENIEMNHNGQFEYFLFENGKEIKSELIDCDQKGNVFYANVNIPNKKDIILKGVFWETNRDSEGRVGGNDIYVIDTLK